MYPPFWFSTLESKYATLILLEGKTKIIYLRRAHCIFRALTHDFHYWIPQLSIRRNTLSWATDSPILQIDSSIESHIHPRNRYQANQTLPVFFCVRVHGFLTCNPTFCKKNSCGTKGPSASSTWK